MTMGKRISQYLSAPLFSSRGFLLVAVAIVILFALASGLGLRAYTSVISLTHDENVSLLKAGTLGGVFLITYFACTVLCPVLVFAAAVFAILHRCLPGKPRSAAR